MAIIKNISLDPNADEDILAWLDDQRNQSASVREAIRYYIAHEDGVTLADVLAELRSLPSRLKVIAATGADESTMLDNEEPAESAANLDGLLDRLDSGAIE